MKDLVLTPALTLKDVRDDLREYVKDKVKPNASKWQRRDVKKILAIAVHHEGGAVLPEVYDGYEEVKRDAAYHVSKNWGSAAQPYYAPNIAYHIQVARNGTAYLCNDLEDIVWHANNANPFTIGICLQGHFEKQEPSIAQLVTLRLLLKHFTQREPTYFGQMGCRATDVWGHTELKGKTLGMKYLWKPIDLGNYTVCPAGLLPYVQEFRKTGDIMKATAGNPPLPSNPTEIGEFIDLQDKTAWYYPYIKICIDAGVIRGFTDGTIRPGQTVSRAEMAKMIVGAIVNQDKIKALWDEQKH